MARSARYRPDYQPGVSAVAGGGTSADAKSPPLEALYPEKADYLTLAPERYCDTEFMRREQHELWPRVWTCAGLEADVRAPGSWLKYDLGAASFIVARGTDGVLRAFHNVCQHRGRQLVSEDFGRGAGFVCGFHSWSYGLDGRNTRVTDREFFDARALCAGVDLPPVRCDTWAGLVFVCMDAAAPPLATYLDRLPEVVAAYDLASMHLVKDVVVAVECNWKVAAEAFLEPYHTHMTHPQILSGVDEVHNQYDFYRHGHSRVITPLSIPSPRLKQREEIDEVLAYTLQAAGLDPAAFSGGAARVREALKAVKRQPDNPFGIDYSRFSDSQLVDNWNPSVFPNLAFNLLPESVQVMRFLPHGSDPGRCLFQVCTLMPSTPEGVKPSPFFGVEEGVDLGGGQRPPRRYTTQADPQLGEVLEQDVANMPLVQRGLASGGMRGGVKLSEQEQRIQQLHMEIDRVMG